MSSFYTAYAPSVLNEAFEKLLFSNKRLNYFFLQHTMNDCSKCQTTNTNKQLSEYNEISQNVCLSIIVTSVEESIQKT